MRLAWTLLLVVAALGAASCGGAAPAPQSVIIVAIDTLRADHLGAYGYPRPTSPNIDAFAAESMVFDRFYSASTWTLPSFGTLFTGQLPSRHAAGVVVRRPDIQEGNEDVLIQRGEQQFTRLDENLPTLATRLRDSGYHTIAVLNNAFLQPEFGLDRGFDVYDYDPDHTERRAERAVDIALAWLDDNEERPVFLFVHFMDIHLPFDPDGSVIGRFTDVYEGGAIGNTLAEVNAARTRISRGDEIVRARYIATYDEEIAYVDEQVGRLFSELKLRGLWDDSLIMLTSDHGESLSEHNRWEHGSSMFDEVVRVPLLVRGPGVRPGRSDVPAAFADIMPTVMGALGVESDTAFFGDSLWPTLTRGIPLDRRSLILEGTLYQAEQKTIIDWPYKAIYRVDGTRLLFNLETDANEMVDLSGIETERLDEMIEALSSSLFEALDERGAATNAELDPATLQNLRALGYIR